MAKHFRRFGLTVHCGDKRNDEKSKTEAMHFPAPRQQSTNDDTADTMLDEHHYFFFTNEFKHLGTTFAPNLTEPMDAKKRINKATGALMSMMKFFKDKSISIKLRKKTCKAIAVNLMSWGCESWALLEKDREKLEACHHQCLQKILGVTIYDVKDQHIKNSTMQEDMDGAHTLTTSLELCRARWLERLAGMTANRSPRKLLVAWTPTPRPTRCPQQTICHSLNNTLKTLQLSSDLKKWIPVARNHQEWAEKVECQLGLKKGSHKYVHDKSAR